MLLPLGKRAPLSVGELPRELGAAPSDMFLFLGGTVGGIVRQVGGVPFTPRGTA